MTDTSSGPDRTIGSGLEDGLAGAGDESQIPQDQPDSQGADAKAAAQSGQPAPGAGASPGTDPAASRTNDRTPTDGEPSTGEQIAGAVDPEPDNAGSDSQGHGRETFA